MKPEDFMLGNYCRDQLTGATLEVSTLTEVGIQFKVIDRTKYPLPDGWEAEPIPITRGWIMCLGFRHKWETEYHLNEVGVILLTNGRCKVYLTGRYIAAIKYVHELQNLHFLITNEKLKLS